MDNLDLKIKMIFCCKDYYLYYIEYKDYFCCEVQFDNGIFNEKILLMKNDKHGEDICDELSKENEIYDLILNRAIPDYNTNNLTNER